VGVGKLLFCLFALWAPFYMQHTVSAEALEASLLAEQDFIRWKNCVSLGKPKGEGSATPAPKWNPTMQDLKSIEDSLAFVVAQQKKAEQVRVRSRAEQKTTVFSGLFGFHLGSGTLPGDGMQGLRRGDDEERAFDAPLRVRFLLHHMSLHCTCPPRLRALAIAALLQHWRGSRTSVHQHHEQS
jgi:hypothetical protein